VVKRQKPSSSVRWTDSKHKQCTIFCTCLHSRFFVDYSHRSFSWTGILSLPVPDARSLLTSDGRFQVQPDCWHGPRLLLLPLGLLRLGLLGRTYPCLSGLPIVQRHTQHRRPSPNPQQDKNVNATFPLRRLPGSFHLSEPKHVGVLPRNISPFWHIILSRIGPCVHILGRRLVCRTTNNRHCYH
jgi:hypothetical protein